MVGEDGTRFAGKVELSVNCVTVEMIVIFTNGKDNNDDENGPRTKPWGTQLQGMAWK